MISYKIKSELSEKQIEADVANYFRWISFSGSVPFRLMDVNEQLTGADKLFNAVIPIYMQFKVSQGLKSLSVPLLPIFREPLNNIRLFRRNSGLYDNPTLYFKIRDKAQNADDYQHNVLLDLANTGYSHAFYVAPLTLNRTHYFNSLHNSAFRYLLDPFSYENIKIHQNNWISHIGTVPFLKDYVSIPPHEKVSTSNHYYSFSPNGTEIAWHSPKIVTYEASRLSDKLIQILKGSLDMQYWINIKDYWLHLEKNFNFINANQLNQNDSSALEKIMIFGKVLKQEYDIHQLLILTTNEHLDKIKKIRQ